jgi:hypothetical protein
MSGTTDRRPGGPHLTKADQFVGTDVLLRHLRRGGPGGLPALTDTHWHAVADEAIRQLIAPLAFRRLKAGPARDTIPPAVLQRLSDYYLRSAFRNALVLREAAAAARLLASHDIPCLFLKGIHLAGWIYAEPALRSMADIDLMVPRDRLADADRAFTEQGWGPLPRPDIAAFAARFPHIAPLQRKGSIEIEIHYAIERPTSPFTIDVDGLWRRAKPVAVEGAAAWVLSAEDLLLHLCLHASYHHRWDRSPLKGLIDVMAVADRCEGELDWNALAKRAKAWGADRFVYCALRLARDLLDAPIPPIALQPLGPDAGDEDVIRLVRHFIITPPVNLPSAYKELRGTRGLRDRLAWLTRNTFLPPDRLRRLYSLRAGSWLVYPYYVVRPFDLLIRRGLLLARMALRTPAMRPTLERERGRDRINEWVDRADDASSHHATVN